MANPVQDMTVFCRTCLGRNDTELMSIFSEVSQVEWRIKLNELLKWFADIEILENSIHQSICVCCVQKLCSAYTFKMQIQNIEQVHLENMLKADEEVHAPEIIEDVPPPLILSPANNPTDQQSTVAEPSQNNSREKCTVCLKKFTSQHKYDRHLLAKHDVRSDVDILKPFRCDTCGKSYTTYANLKHHILTHSQVRPFVCQSCGKSFFKSNSLQNHMALHTGQKKHACNQCGRSFTSANILHQHKRTHTGIRGYKCDECGKGFYTQNDLKMHVRMHTGEKPFLCSTCGKAFARQTHLNIHLRTHSGERPYTCTTCSKSFAQSGDLKAHIRTHTGEKPFACKVCGKTFNQSSGLAAHRRSHIGVKGFNCHICNRGFTQNSSLARHLKIHDKTPVSASEKT